MFFVFSRKIHNDVDCEVTPEYFKQNIISAIRQLFGEVSACVDIDILKYNFISKRAVVRVPGDYYVKTRSSLTLCGKYQDTACSYQIHKASPVLLNLQGDSRDYTF